jgi:glycosyltransferase involved in cell wall biosynthesis
LHDYPVWLKKHARGIDLFHLVDHSYSQLILELPAERTVVTCHDLDTFNCLLDPASDPRPRWFRAIAQRSLDGFLRAAHVISVSAFTRANLLRHGLFPSERITVIPPGADPTFFCSSETLSAEVAQRVGGMEQPYLLHVGSTIRRKRIDVLLRVFAKVVREFPRVRLVRVGGDFTTEQAQLAEKLDLGGKIVYTPRLSTADLAGVYRQAALVLQTSDAEGFGLPVIEALATGCPVVASDIAPLREAGGSAAEYCKVADIDAWSQTVIQLLHERKTAAEAWELRRDRGRRHASDYTWMENANRTISVYDRVLGTDGGVPQL